MADAATLLGLFYESPADLGRLEEVAVDDLSADYRKLLAHDEHMTVAVEQFHGGPVDLRVLETIVTPTHYARKILLARQSDGEVVQFGIVRLNFQYLADDVRRQIESRNKPLGRILIEHNVLRQVQLLALLRVEPGPDLCELFGLARPLLTFGRTALIYCNGEPAVELLEIVAPV
jgi:chorismate-pyruvate lyase